MDSVLFSNQISKACKGNNDGFLLVELLVALGVFCFFLYLMHCYSGLTLTTSHQALQRYEALTVLKSYCHALKKDTNYTNKNGSFVVTKKKVTPPLRANDFTQSHNIAFDFYILEASWTGMDKKKYKTSLITNV